MRSRLHRDISRVFFLLTLGLLPLAGCGDVSLGPEGASSLLASSLSAGDSHSCAITGGKVQCWGLNTSGQLGNGTSTSSLTPVFVSGITDAVQVQAGGKHTCARLSSGAVWCWGDNTEGQLGNGSFTSSLVPVLSTGVSSAVSVSAGGYHTCAVRADGRALCWGRNIEGQLGDARNITSNLPVQVFGITTASTISTGGAHTCARLADSTIQCWGSNTLDQLGNTALVAASRNTPIAVTGINTAVSISAGTGHSCAEVASPSRVRCWGDNFSGQLAREWTAQLFPDPPLMTSPEALNVTGITTPNGAAAGYAHSCAALDDNTIRCWGENFDGQLGNGTVAGFIPPDPSASATSTIVPVTVSGITAATQVVTGQFHSCALLLNGTVMCWGRNSSGQLGDGTGVVAATPVEVTLLP
ncbi:MAG: hypothetical protein IT362_10660 [Deltaproteobacteria bacterium]|nr:hypothetical protein [Deltaproteobacteria bacterium]